MKRLSKRERKILHAVLRASSPDDRLSLFNADGYNYVNKTLDINTQIHPAEYSDFIGLAMIHDIETRDI
jgi:hypothetical protein